MAEASSRHLSNGGGSGSGRPSVGSKSTWPTGTGGTSEAVASSAAVSVQLGNIVRRMDQDLGQDELLRVTLVLCRILQNAIVYGSEQARYRSVKLNAPVLSVTGVVDFLLLSGFEHDDKGTHIILPEPLPLQRIEASKQRLLSARRRYNVVSGLEVPCESLKVGERIGKGKFGEVHKGSWDGQPVAIKMQRHKSNEQADEEFHREATIMRPLDHSNVVPLLAVALTVKPSYLVMELMRCCFLDSLHEGAASSPGEQLEYTFQVAAGMDYLHHQQILHCDLAARNILINSDSVLKISDFGLARRLGSPECNLNDRSVKFPTRWTAPEVLVDRVLSKGSDVWSFGVLFYEFVTGGSVPYGDMTNAETRKRVTTGYRLPQPHDCPDEFHSVMVKCWSKSPSSRPSFSAILSDLAKDRAKFVSGMLHFRRNPANDDARPGSSSPGSSGSVSSVDSNNTWTDAAAAAGAGGGLAPNHVSPSQSPSPQLRHEKEKRGRSAAGKLKKFTFGRSSVDNLLKGDSVVCVYTILVSPFQPSIVVPLKPKHRSSDLIPMVLKRLGKSSNDASQYALVEIKTGTSSSSSASFQSRFIIDSERPLSIKAMWPHNHSCHFVLCSSHGNDNSILSVINQHFSCAENEAILHQRCRGYILTFQELRSGAKMAGRSKAENWQRYWGFVDGSSLLLYRDEETEENDSEPMTHIRLDHSNTEQAGDVSKKRDVLRVCTAQGDTHLLRTCGKDDMYRWLLALTTASSSPPSAILEKFGDGEILHTGFLLIDETAHSNDTLSTEHGPSVGGDSAIGSRSSSRSSLGLVSSSVAADRDARLSQRGMSQSSNASEPSISLPSLKDNPAHRRLLCVLKGRQLLAFVGNNRRELLDFADVIAISVLNPTSLLNWSMSHTSGGEAMSAASSLDDDECLMTFGIQIDVKQQAQAHRKLSVVGDARSSSGHVVRYFLKPDTPGDLDSWTDAFDRLLLKLGKNDLMVHVDSDPSPMSTTDEIDGPLQPPVATAGPLSIPDIQEEAPKGGLTRNDSSGLNPIRRSIRRRQESGFIAVAKLRKSSADVDESFVYDNELTSSQTGASRKSAAGNSIPSKAAAEESLLSPVSEQSKPMTQQIKKFLATSSPSKVEQLKALVASRDMKIDDDDVLSPSHSHRSLTKSASNSSSLQGGQASPTVASPEKTTSPKTPLPPPVASKPLPPVASKPSPPVAPRKTMTTSGSSEQLDSVLSERHSAAPATNKPVPSPRTMRRNRDTESQVQATSTSSISNPESSAKAVASTEHVANVLHDKTSTAVSQLRMDATPPSRKKAPPAVSPKPTRKFEVKPSPPPAPVRAPVTKLSDAASNVAEALNRLDPTGAEKGHGSSNPATDTADGFPAESSNVLPEPPPLPADSESPPPPPRPPLPADPSCESPPPPLPSEEPEERCSPTPLLPTSSNGMVTQMSLTRHNASPEVRLTPPLPPDSDSKSNSPARGSPARVASPPPLPKKSRSGSAHSALISQTLPRHLPRGSISLDTQQTVGTQASSVSTGNLSGQLSPAMPPLPPKTSPARRYGSRESSREASIEELDRVDTRYAAQQHQPFYKSTSHGDLLAHSGSDHHFRQQSSPARFPRTQTVDGFEQRYQRSGSHAHRHPLGAALSVTSNSSPVAEEYIDMTVGSSEPRDEYIDMNQGSGVDGHEREEYVEMNDQSTPADSHRERQMSLHRRQQYPLQSSDSRATVSSGSSAATDEYVPMSPIDADSYLHGTSITSVGMRSVLSATHSIDSFSSSHAPSQEYVDMADDISPAGARGMMTSPRHMSRTSPYHSSSRGVPANPHTGASYTSIAQDGPTPSRPHPYASIADDDPGAVPPPLPSRPAGGMSRGSLAPLGTQKAGDTSKTRGRAESVPSIIATSLFKGKRSIAGTSKSSPASTAATATTVPSPRQRSATVSTSSVDGVEDSSGKGKSKSKTKKSKMKEKDVEKKTLPPLWQMVKDTFGDIYFFEPETGRTAWSYDAMMALYEISQRPNPGPPKGKSATDAGSGWKTSKSQEGRTYYYSKKKQMSTYTIQDTWH